jgi:hypothetical protein
MPAPIRSGLVIAESQLLNTKPELKKTKYKRTELRPETAKRTNPDETALRPTTQRDRSEGR